MEQELAGALAELGLSATEAEIYVELLKFTKAGPVSSYKLAQEMGRDPANMTKVLAAMHRRGAVRASGRRPRLYTPVAPEEFTGRRIATLQETQQRALALLRDIGNPPPDQDLHQLNSRLEALSSARHLISGARHAVLINGTADLLGSLAGALRNAATRQSVMVLACCPDVVELPDVRVRNAKGLEAWHGAAPGPWLRLAVDGEACLEMLAHPTDERVLLHGHWSCCPTQAFLAHRSLAGELILNDLHELLRDGIGGALACRQVADQSAYLLHQIAWRQRWRDAGLPEYAPVSALTSTPTAEPGSRNTVDLSAASYDPAEKEAEQADSYATPAANIASQAASEAAGDDQSGPLQFVFRRRKD